MMLRYGSLALLWVCLCLPSIVLGWVAEEHFSVRKGAAAQTWLFSPLGPSGDNPFKFASYGTAQLDVACVVGDLVESSSEEALAWMEFGLHLLLCQPQKTVKYTNGEKFNCQNSVDQCIDSFSVRAQYRCDSITPGLSSKTAELYTNTSLKVSLVQVINDSGRATPIAVTCCSRPAPVDYTCKATISLINPDGNHLSVDEFSLPRIYLLCLLGLCTALALWLVNAVYYWRFSNKLHILITIVALVLEAELAISYWKWSHIKETGMEDSLTKYALYCVTSIKWSVSFLFMMTAGFGMGIACAKPQCYQRIIVADVIILFSLLLYNFVNSYILALTVITALLCIFCTIRYVRLMLATLYKLQHSERRFFRRYPEAAYTSKRTLKERLEKKRYLMQVVLMYSLAFPMVYIIGSAVTAARYPYQTNIQLLARGALECLVVMLLLWFFRLRDCHAFYNIKIGKAETVSNSAVVVGACKKTMFYCDKSEKKSSRRRRRERRSAAATAAAVAAAAAVADQQRPVADDNAAAHV